MTLAIQSSLARIDMIVRQIEDEAQDWYDDPSCEMAYRLIECVGKKHSIDLVIAWRDYVDPDIERVSLANTRNLLHLKQSIRSHNERFASLP